MITVINRLNKALNEVPQMVLKQTTALKEKTTPEKWSKLEILGHLIDSGINNLQRFTEIRFMASPYVVRSYPQNELVIANEYQKAAPQELLNLWLAVNERIKLIMLAVNEEELSLPLKLGDDSSKDLRFLMTDYIDHLEHHLNQLKP